MSDELSNGEAVASVFDNEEEARANPKHGKDKEWELFCTEFTETIQAGTKVWTWKGGGGVAQNANTSYKGVRTYKADSRRGSGSKMSASKLDSQWDEMTEEEQEQYLAVLEEKKKAKKVAARAAAQKKQEEEVGV